MSIAWVPEVHCKSVLCKQFTYQQPITWLHEVHCKRKTHHTYLWWVAETWLTLEQFSFAMDLMYPMSTDLNWHKYFIAFTYWLFIWGFTMPNITLTSGYMILPDTTYLWTEAFQKHPLHRRGLVASSYLQIIVFHQQSTWNLEQKHRRMLMYASNVCWVPIIYFYSSQNECWENE